MIALIRPRGQMEVWIMKICPNCQENYDDTMKFCLQCGTELVDAPVAQAAAQPAPEAPAPEAQAPVYHQPQPQAQYENNAPYGAAYGAQANAAYAAPQYAAPADPDDHTAEFDAEDIAQNKLYAVSVYLFGIIGIIIAALVAKDSAFVKFHIRQVLKFMIVSTILAVAAVLLSWTIVVPIAAGVCVCIVLVLEIISFVQACKGQAKDPAIIKKIGFLK